jgi:hypothetical protein
MITDKLLHEALECPIALTELNYQFTNLTEAERNEWISAMSYEDVRALMDSIRTLASGVGAIILSLMGYNLDTEMEMMEMLYNKNQSGPLREPGLPDTFEEARREHGF